MWYCWFYKWKVWEIWKDYRQKNKKNHHVNRKCFQTWIVQTYTYHPPLGGNSTHMFPWYNGYHTCLTHKRPLVQNWVETLYFFLTPRLSNAWNNLYSPSFIQSHLKNLCSPSFILSKLKLTSPAPSSPAMLCNCLPALSPTPLSHGVYLSRHLGRAHQWDWLP